MTLRSRITGALLGMTALTVGLTGCGSDPAGAEGTWGEGGEGQPQLVRDATGTLSGTDGCNRLTGAWSQEGDAVTFTDVASTLMACEDVDTWLSGLATATVAGNTLRILDGSGTEIGTLSR